MNLTDLADRSAGGDDGNGCWREHLQHAEKNDLLAIAPHGGEMEPGTAEQAFHVATSLDSCSGWAYCGYVDEGSARERYYTTSTEIRPSEYAFLSTLADHGFALAVAFHGYRPDDAHPDVYVGGTLEPSARATLVDSIARESGLDVRLARPGDGLESDYGGVSPQNIVNRLGTSSVQIEQTDDARDAFGTDICRGLVDGLETLRTT